MTPEDFSGRGLDPTVDELKRIQRQIEVQPRVSWAYVTGLNPLRVRLERDDFPLLGRAQTLVHESMLEVGDRVEVIIQNGRAIVQGKGGGVPKPPEPTRCAFMAELSAPHSRSGAQSYQKVPFNNPVMNIGNAFHTGRTRFEAPVDGLYEFISQFAFTTTTTGPTLQYYVNGSGPVLVGAGALAYNNPYDPTSMTQMLELSAGDYVEVYMMNANNTSVTLARAYGTRFMGKLLYQYAA